MEDPQLTELYLYFSNPYRFLPRNEDASESLSPG